MPRDGGITASVLALSVSIADRATSQRVPSTPDEEGLLLSGRVEAGLATGFVLRLRRHHREVGHVRPAGRADDRHRSVERNLCDHRSIDAGSSPASIDRQPDQRKRVASDPRVPDPADRNIETRLREISLMQDVIADPWRRTTRPSRKGPPNAERRSRAGPQPGPQTPFPQAGRAPSRRHRGMTRHASHSGATDHETARSSHRNSLDTASQDVCHI